MSRVMLIHLFQCYHAQWFVVQKKLKKLNLYSIVHCAAAAGKKFLVKGIFHSPFREHCLESEKLKTDCFGIF